MLDGSCSAVHRVFGAGCCVFLPTRPPLCGWFALCVALGFLVLPLCVCVCVCVCVCAPVARGLLGGVVHG